MIGSTSSFVVVCGPCFGTGHRGQEKPCVVCKSQGRLILQPLKDPEEVDERRHKMGMEPLAEYEAELRRFYNAN